MAEINYDKMDSKIINAVKAIEAKPHVRYIRYLMTKRYSPICIKQELFRLGLSAPHEPNLIAYYLAVIDPVVKQFGLSQLYADYKNKLLRKNKRGDFAKEILNYRLNLGDDLDGQVKFCKFIKAVEVDEIWLTEIYKFYGTADRMPVDENGQRILDAMSPRKTLEKILTFDKRYIIDKMILENVPDSRISKYCRENLKLVVNDYDIAGYKRIFFNVKTLSIEERIKSLEIERNSLSQLLDDFDSLDYYSDMDIGEKTLIRRQTEQRIIELDDNIKSLNMLYSDFAFKQATQDSNDFESMFTNVVCSLYNRFKSLDQFKDRDVVDPIFKVAKMMVFTHDKVEQIKAVSGPGKTGPGDQHSQNVLMELYKQRSDEIMAEQIKKTNEALKEAGIEPLDPSIDPNEIMGIEELGINLDLSKDDEEEE
jgi:hypothetical protein